MGQKVGFLREGREDFWLRQGVGAALRLRHDVTCLQCWTEICGDRCIEAGRWDGASASRGLSMVTTLGGLECGGILHGRFHRWRKGAGFASCMPVKGGWPWWEGKGTEARLG